MTYRDVRKNRKLVQGMDTGNGKHGMFRKLNRMLFYFYNIFYLIMEIFSFLRGSMLGLPNHIKTLYRELFYLFVFELKLLCIKA